jgi:multicomponent Na+:H+ antiporter subunit F
MEWFYLLSATWLLLNVLAGMVRIARGPTAADRMLSAQLFGTTGVAALLLLAQGMGVTAIRDVALVVAILAAVAIMAFVQRVWGRPPSREQSDGPC